VSKISYVNFDLAVRAGSPTGFQVMVDSSAGQVVQDFASPFTAAELDDLRQAITGPLRAILPANARNALAIDYADKVKQFGERLYESVFTNAVRANLALCIQEATRQQYGVRIRVRLDDAPDLAALPWEYLYDRDGSMHLALWDRTPIVRHIRLPGPPSAVVITPPIKMLVMISDPRRQLDTEAEWRNILTSLKKLIDEGLVSVTRVAQPTVTALRECYRQGDCHILHYIGHGGFDTQGNPALLLEDDFGQEGWVAGMQLDVALGHAPLRLVVLNSCDGAIGGARDPLAGLAQRLLKRNIPTVVAMQFKITDRAAIMFAGIFYKSIADSLPIDQALVEARIKMYSGNNPTEWGTPVLYMTNGDGRVFDIVRPNEEQLREQQIDALTADAQTAIKSRQYQRAIEKLTEITNLLPGGRSTA
jgi:CHAT domain